MWDGDPLSETGAAEPHQSTLGGVPLNPDGFPSTTGSGSVGSVDLRLRGSNTLNPLKFTDDTKSAVYAPGDLGNGLLREPCEARSRLAQCVLGHRSITTVPALKLLHGHSDLIVKRMTTGVPAAVRSVETRFSPLGEPAQHLAIIG